MKNEEQFFYLFASPSGKRDESPRTVFYKAKGESTCKSLSVLFVSEYTDGSGNPTFTVRDAHSISAEEQVLLDELLDLLTAYDDPDPGIYDPEPSGDVLLRAQYALRASKWEELLRQRTHATDQDKDTHDCTSARRETGSDELPEFPPEEQRNSVLILLMLLAQAYYKMLECTISMASIVTELDLELNQSYVWTVESITNLLKNSEHLKDFPITFEPLFTDLYPSTIGDLEWQGEIAPDAEGFLSTVQRYVLGKGIYDPENGSPGWCFIELYRPSVNAAIDRAEKYDVRMRKYYRRFLASTSKTNESQPKADENIGAGADSTNFRAQSTPSPSDGTGTCTRDKIFVSYSHKDRRQFEEFKTMLAPAIRNGAVFWDDTRIRAGTRWEQEIQIALKSAKIAVLLVSEHFLASDFIVKEELQPMLKAASNDGVIILWIYLSACNYEVTEIRTLQAAHDVSRPLNRLTRPKRIEVLKEIAVELIRRAQDS